jgi:hypothetical protein
MQAIFEYLSVGDLYGLAGIAVMVAVLAANCRYQKHRTLAHDRIAQGVARPASRPTPAANVTAHA